MMTTIETLQTINAETLNQRLKGTEPPILINALSQDSYISEHIPGSINIPSDNAEAAKEVIPYMDAEIVVYCASADCDASPHLVQKLEDMKYTNITDFEEGIKGWKSAGFKLAGNDV